MPSLVLGYIAGSGFTPLISGWSPYSGHNIPIGGIQLFADTRNSGAIYVSLSGGNAFSGQISTLVGSGGPTITSGGAPLSGAGLMDGFQVPPGGGYFVPKTAIFNQGSNSGNINVCLGCDTTCSGQARVFYEIF